MQNPIISTKLYKPSIESNLVARNRLIEKLNSGLNCKLILISAPAGFGKTTLLAEWIAKTEIPVAWVSIDKGDNDPVRFLSYLLAAIQSINPSFGGNTISVINSPQETPAENIITAFINEINSNLGECTLILDDYYLIDSEAIQKAMIFFLEHLPINIHLVIATRHDPPFPLSKMRVRKQVCEIREADLRFNSEEAAAFFRDTMEINLNHEEVEILEDRTEGWVASLQLAALAMQGRKDIHQFIKDFRGSHNYIVDYLTEEVLEHLDVNMQEFLLFTSILDRFNSPLCDAVTGGTESRSILDFLDKSKLFLVPLDENKNWFRYHHLFSDLLKYRLEQLFPDAVNVLHKRASEWFEKNGFTEDALNQSLAAGDNERAADLIEAASIPTLVRGELATIQNWSEKIPDGLLSERAHILIALGWVHCIRGDIKKAEPFLVKVESVIDSPAKKYSDRIALDLRGHIALIRSYNFSPMFTNRYEDVFKQRELILKAKEYLEKDNPILHSTLNLFLGWTYIWTGEWESGKEAFKNAQVYGEISGNHLVTLSGVYNQSVIMIIQGKLKKAYNICSNAINDYKEKYGEFFLPLGFTYAGMGNIHYMMNQFSEAEDHLNNSLIIAEMMGNWTIFFHAISLLMIIKQKTGETKSVKALLKREEEALSKSPSYIKELSLDVQKVNLWLIQKNIKLAETWLEKFNSDPMKDAPYYLYGEILAVRILIEKEEYFNALSLLDKNYTAVKKIKAYGWLMENLILKSMIYFKEEETERSLTEIREALSIAEPEGFTRLFINEGKAMAELLTNALTIYRKDKSFNTEFVSEIIKEINSEVSLSSQPLQEPLSDRELEILHLLAAGFSNKAIADKLFVAIGTVKKHTHQIYQKLNVDSRTKAIQSARELNLI